MRTGIIIQARTSSTRLPAKVLKELPLGSKTTILQQVVRRAQAARRAQAVVVATTTGPEDAPIARLARREGALVFRGSKDDVLSRYYFAAKTHGIDTVVRVTSDCPNIDPKVIDMVLARHARGGFDFTYNRGFAGGQDVEVASFSALERAHREAKRDFEREHVMVYLRESRPDLFSVGVLDAPKAMRQAGVKLSVDTTEDYALSCAIHDFLGRKTGFFGAADVVRLFKRRPWLALINARSYQKQNLFTIAQEFSEARRLLELYGFPRVVRHLNRR